MDKLTMSKKEREHLKIIEQLGGCRTELEKQILIKIETFE
jgi:hypothetical protein